MNGLDGARPSTNTDEDDHGFARMPGSPLPGLRAQL